MMLVHGSVYEVLSAVAKFGVSRFLIYCAVCVTLGEDGRLTEEVERVRQMQSELPEDAGIDNGRTRWEFDCRGRCIEKLEKLGDKVARDSKKHDQAIVYYSSALSPD
ncbi:hypothetical protein EV363DRAFT_1160946 [Boletus edulis]|uniref:Uncharacterized protein n=1 Tax=Boletus edulis BED1 TaxID=1328754 RepID=A0AAD4GHE4_BOLED|nr:hypothetical protein EV363DRAFT_1160946 [Boletus edulis]KAF8444932.1 hypothetical protein L210DRAFT_3643114 [Boletus edulis BED1]